MNKCFICNKNSSETILDLGQSPIANNLELDIKRSRTAKKYPLKLSICRSGCNHVQISEAVDQSDIFRDYFYTPSVSKTLSEHLKNISKDLENKFEIADNPLIVDIGSNDGTFLEAASNLTKNILGVDPAKNLSDIANKKGIKTINDFFSFAVSKEIKNKYGNADFIISTNTFAHTPKINDFAKGLKNLISDDGVIIIEIHYLGSMINDTSFDTIYHEHFSYWSLENLINLFTKYGLNIFDACLMSVHHGQLRIYMSKSKKYKKSKLLNDLLKKEKNENLIGEKLSLFCKNVLDIKENLLDLFEKISKEGKKICGYGAPAKASTLINFIGNNNLEFIYDKSKLKQGKYIPGTGIKIKDPFEIKGDSPDYIFLFAWNFSKEIINDLRNNYSFKGKLIIPIPELNIINIG
tara:strand:- start:1018 stop:2241 length:1224 start_codon:yes stop_codon:yes gene_type:complete